MLIIYLLVKSDGGPGFFLHERVGRHGKLFNCIKFRSMQQNSDVILNEFFKDNPDAQREWELKHKLAYDPRVTRFGRYLRRMSLDELPQLWSILRGDMSFVGPRPALFNQNDLIELRTEKGVHELVPGLTGWAQVNGRDELPITQKVQLDLEYMQRQSLLFDLKILWMTALKVLARDGVRH
jgi:O-antigen biosynthesis protein WbqP